MHDMPFETPISTARAASFAESDDDTPAARTQLALRLGGGAPLDLADKRGGRATPQEVHANIIHLSGQLDALRQQLDEHSADRMATLLREMIEERERELDLWLAREASWDRRLAVIEDAIAERDRFREREAALIRERDAARRAAEIAAAERVAAERAAEAARREAAQVQRLAERANAEQLRLRAERELDHRAWVSERRQLADRIERKKERGWLGRLIGS